MSPLALQAFELALACELLYEWVTICRSLGIPARYVSGYFYAITGRPQYYSQPCLGRCLLAGRRWVSVDVIQLRDRRSAMCAGDGHRLQRLSIIRAFGHGGGEESMTVSTSPSGQLSRSMTNPLRCMFQVIERRFSLSRPCLV
jgi:hypothetical protein